MNVGKAIYYLLANSASVTELVSTRIFPEVAEQEAPTPFVVYEIISVDPDDTNDGPATLDEVTVDVTAISDTYDEAADISSRCRAALDRVRGTYNGVNVESIQFSTVDSDVYNSPRRYAQTATYIVRVRRDDAQIATGQDIDDLTILRLADTPSDYGTSGQVLAMTATLDGVEWVDAGGAINELDDVGDVNAAEPLDRQALAYDEATGEWIADGVGQVVIPIRNNSANQTLNKGVIVAFAGTQGDRILVEPWDNASPSAYIVGVLSESLAGGADGHAQTYGEIRQLDTSAYSLDAVLYASAGGAFTTTANSLPVATVTRVHANTGRIFVRLYVPGDHYRDRYRAEAYTAATAHSIAPAAVETYYTAQANGDGFYQLPGDDTPRNQGDVVRRTIYWKSGAFAATNSGSFTEVVLDDDSTYTQLLAAIDDILNANGAPITIWSKREEVTPSAAILDGYTDDLTAAFASALLVPDYAGACIRIRRSGDNAEQDIGFDGTDLDRDAIANFCSPGDGFVKTWYDQSGNGNDATQTNTALQLKIYDSSTGVILENARPAIEGIGTDGAHYNISATSLSGDMAIFAVASFDATGLDSMLLGGTGATGAKAYIFRPLSNRISITNNSQNGFADFDTTIAAQTLISLTRTGTDVRIKVNEIDSTQTERATQGLDFTVYRIGGAFNNAYSLDGRIQAVILYNADKSSDRADIETALNDYFNVY